MIEIWLENKQPHILRAVLNADWYERYNTKWGCWTICGLTYFDLLERGWKRLK